MLVIPLAFALFKPSGRRRRFSAQALEIESTERKSREILETALDSFVGMDSIGKIVDWNAQAVVTFAWSRDVARGRLLFQIILLQRSRASYELAAQQFMATRPVLSLPGRRNGRQDALLRSCGFLDKPN
jgi:PAS domain-containing protein